MQGNYKYHNLMGYIMLSMAEYLVNTVGGIHKGVSKEGLNGQCTEGDIV
jgi:hypothetical protein